MPDPSNLDRAAEVLFNELGGTVGTTVQALVDAGLLVTDEIQAVLDAAVAYISFDTDPYLALRPAVDAYLATRGPA